MTLIEVMLAIAILATIMGLTWGTVSSSFRYRTASLDKFDRYRASQQALERMSRELSMAFVTNIGQGATNDRGEVTYSTGFWGDDDEVSFTSLAHVRTRAGEPTSEQCEITYRLERQRGTDGDMHQNLVRREQAPIDDEPEEGGVKYTLLYDVEDIRFEYWDATREIAGEAWVRSWDALSEHNGQLPVRVKITLEVAHPLIENETIEFVTQTRLAMPDPLVILPPDVLEAISQATAEDCGNNTDDDMDGNTDCNDDECLENPRCLDDGAESNIFENIANELQGQDGDEERQ